MNDGLAGMYLCECLSISISISISREIGVRVNGERSQKAASSGSDSQDVNTTLKVFGMFCFSNVLIVSRYYQRILNDLLYGLLFVTNSCSQFLFF